MANTATRLEPFTTTDGVIIYPIHVHVGNPRETKGLQGEVYDIHLYDQRPDNPVGGPGSRGWIGWIRRVGSIAQHVGIDPSYRRQGLGTKLVELMLEDCSDLYPDTDIDPDGQKLLKTVAKTFSRPDWLEALPEGSR